MSSDPVPNIIWRPWTGTTLASTWHLAVAPQHVCPAPCEPALKPREAQRAPQPARAPRSQAHTVQYNRVVSVPQSEFRHRGRQAGQDGEHHNHRQWLCNGSHVGGSQSMQT